MKVPAMKCILHFGVRNDAVFYSDRKKVHAYKVDGATWSARTGLVKLANGQTYRAVIECCDHDSGEHYGTMIWTGSGLMDLHDEENQKMIGLTKANIFPYRYKHDTPIDGDHHCGDNGWSR
jgi:hypothetical protein